MKNTISLILFFISFILCGQKKDYNLKEGYIAEGYDVVSYFENEAKEGKKEFTATYNNVKFKFISKEHLKTFKKNPEKFIPQYGGWCAYALGKKDTKLNIDPETFEIIDGKLYLFYNSWGSNTQKKWNKENPVKLRKKADLNWSNYK